MTKPYSVRFRTLALALTLPFMASCAKKISKDELDTMYREAQEAILANNTLPPEFPELTVDNLQRECGNYCVVPKYIQRNGAFLYDKKTGEPYIEKLVFPMLFENDGVVIIELPLDKPVTESQIASGEAQFDLKGESKERSKEIIDALYAAMKDPSPKTEEQKQATLAVLDGTGPVSLKPPRVETIDTKVIIQKVRGAEKDFGQVFPGLRIKARAETGLGASGANASPAP